MNRLFLSTSRPFWLLKRLCLSWSRRNLSFLTASLLSWSPYSADATWVNWQSETEVTIDPVQKKLPCGACHGGRSFVFPRFGRSNETEPGRSCRSAKSQVL